MADLREVGGEKYARLSALAYRQALAAQKSRRRCQRRSADVLQREFSNGSIGTVDIMYPTSPLMMLLSPTYLKATMEPILLYSAGPRWPFPFAPHDVGVYPQATGMLYGGGENIPANGDVSGKMPVEESGNMLLMLGALSKIEGNTKYADRHWPTITKWANFLISKGYDLDNQLSTDDFAGHMAHSVNLSGKSIEAIGAYAQMCQMRGDTAEATACAASPREWPHSGWPPPKTATITSWLLTSRALGARNTIWSGTKFWASICSPAALPPRKWPTTRLK